jgi:hypothetical protein
VILREDSRLCEIPTSDLLSNFSTTTPPTIDAPVPPYLPSNEPDDLEDLTFEVHPEEVIN